MRKMALFGANEDVGLEFVQHAQERHCRVKVMINSNQYVLTKYPTLESAEYTFNDKKSVVSALEGCNSVVIVIDESGMVTADQYNPLYSMAIRVLISALKETGIKHLIILSDSDSTAWHEDLGYGSSFFKPRITNSYINLMKMANQIDIAAKGINWIIACPLYPMGGNSKLYLIKEQKIGKGNFRISRLDLMDYILSEQDEYS